MQGLPDFLVIGAARAGTTAIYSYLRQCPDIFMPRVKEPNFFAFEGEALACAGPGADYINNSVTSLAAYRDLFATAPASAIKGEASPLYLFAPEAPARIRRHTPDARLVVVLRRWPAMPCSPTTPPSRAPANWPPRSASWRRSV